MSDATSISSARFVHYIKNGWPVVGVLLLITAIYFSYSRLGHKQTEVSAPSPLPAPAPVPAHNTASEHAISKSEAQKQRSSVANDVIEPVTDNNGLRIVAPVEWQLQGTLLEHIEPLKAAAQNGDDKAAFVLAMNLRACLNVPADDGALEQKLSQAYQYSDSDRAVNQLSMRYAFCKGIDKTARKQFYDYLASAANNDFVPAQEHIGKITTKLFMSTNGYGALARDEFVQKRDQFTQQKREYLQSAAQHGSIDALMQLSRMHFAQNFGDNGRLQAYAMNLLILRLTEDNEHYNKYSWYQHNLERQLTPEEVEQAIQMSQEWQTNIETNGTVYLP